MWKVVGAQPSHSICLFVTLSSMMVLLLFVATLPTSGNCLPLSHSGGTMGSSFPSSTSASSAADIGTGVDLAQLHNLVREAFKFFHKLNSNTNVNTNKGADVPEPAPAPVEATRISGQVNLRYPRSELGDVALRLWNLQEMDRKYGAKARPRFGKRNEVTQDNFIPMYGDEELKDSTLGATGDSYPVVPPLLFVP